MKRKLKILVIEDDLGILEAIQLLLQKKGYKVELSVNGETAMKLVNSRRILPNLIILDILLSGKNGIVIARNLKQHPKTKHIPIIILSAQPSAEYSIRKYGVDDFLAKPFDIDVLLEKITKYIG